MRQNKYRSTKVKTSDGNFDSKKEYRRWLILKDMQERGEISDLRRQVAFLLIPIQRGDDGKTIERACKYIADFVYEAGGKTIVEDTKGVKTPEYIIKRKLMLHLFGIKIKEV